MLQDAIPAKARRYVYVIGALIGLTLTSTQAAFASLDTGSPDWLIAAFAAYGVVAAGFGLTAAGNVNSPPETGKHRITEEEAPVDYGD